MRALVVHNFLHEKNPLSSSNKRMADGKGQLMCPILPLVCGLETNNATQMWGKVLTTFKDWNFLKRQRRVTYWKCVIPCSYFFSSFLFLFFFFPFWSACSLRRVIPVLRDIYLPLALYPLHYLENDDVKIYSLHLHIS